MKASTIDFIRNLLTQRMGSAKHMRWLAIAHGETGEHLENTELEVERVLMAVDDFEDWISEQRLQP